MHWKYWVFYKQEINFSPIALTTMWGHQTTLKKQHSKAPKLFLLRKRSKSDFGARRNIIEPQQSCYYLLDVLIHAVVCVDLKPHFIVDITCIKLCYISGCPVICAAPVHPTQRTAFYLVNYCKVELTTEFS